MVLYGNSAYGEINGPRGFKLFVLFLLFVSTVVIACGQDTTHYNQRLYHSYITDHMEQWKGIIGEMSQDYEMTGNQEILYDLCFAYYGYIGYLISEEEDKAARKVLAEAITKTGELDRLLAGRHDVLALQGAMLGYRIILSKFTSMYLGPKALKYIKTAYESADSCFNCNIEMGNMLFYTPPLFGGSKTESVQHYRRAVEILERSQLKTDHNWIYINTILLLANAYKETGRQDLACTLFEQVLEYEPAAEWIRKELYSKCQQ